MRKTIYYCDRCRKEIEAEKIHPKVETKTDGHQVTIDEWLGTFEQRLRTVKKRGEEV